MSGHLREAFEKWITAVPYERSVERTPLNAEHSWPGQYEDEDVQMAWEAWLAATDHAGMPIPEKPND